jgi:hypothetical protein
MNHPGYGFRRPREFPAYPGTPFTTFTVLRAGATEVTPLVPGYGSGGKGATFSRAGNVQFCALTVQYNGIVYVCTSTNRGIHVRTNFRPQ